ncbi:MAG: DNA-binding protein [Anaerolineae bacterium]|nr:DNA-binding protein [Anaerolineae bacterium]
MSETIVSVVCDAGPIIHLDELAVLNLLNDFQQILVPHQVWQEVELHRPEALTRTDVTLERLEVAISDQVTFQTLVKAMSLDLGEQAALSLMKSHPQAILLTDDAAARLAATTMGYQIHGTIGILLRAIRRQQRSKSEVLQILRNLPHKSTLHIRASLLQEIIDQLEE